MVELESDEVEMSTHAPEVNNDDDSVHNPEPNDELQDTSNGYHTTPTTATLPNQQEDAAIQEFTLLIILQPDGVRHRVLVTAEHTLAAVVDMLCNDLRLQPEMITFPEFRNEWGQITLRIAIGVDAIMAALDPETDPPLEPMLQAHVSRRTSTEEYVLPEQIQVQVYDEKEHIYRTITVDITKFASHKPYLGGFRHKKTQQIFHHASAQTVVTRARRTYGPRAHRITQTQVLTTRSQQTTRESGTQMERRDLSLETSCDRIVIAKPYFDSYQLHCLQHDSCLVIQRLWRGFQARRYVTSLKERKRRIAVLNQLGAQEDATLDVEHQRREIQRRMHPKTVNDFEILYNELEKWSLSETNKIQQDPQYTGSGPAKQLALSALLEKETKLLQTIDRLKLTATASNRTHRIESMLQFLARPKQWQMSDGGVKEVHTPFTTRAKELMDLYHGLKMPLTSMEERLDILLHVKWTVNEFDCSLTREIMSLVDREADLLNRGRKDKSLEGLRKRLNNLYLQFVENPEFNPEAIALKHTSTSTGTQHG